MKIDLQIRDLKTGETSQKAFESTAEAETWLRERPQFTEVLGVASHHIPKDVSMQLKEARRPLDAEEEALMAELEKQREEQLRQQAEAQQKRDAEAALRHQAALANADPNRLMEVRWRFNADMANGEKGDPREVNDEVRAAVEAWVEERNGWVQSRGQMVGEASVKVWPGPLPEGKTERVEMGSFVPVSAPRKEEA